MKKTIYLSVLSMLFFPFISFTQTDECATPTIGLYEYSLPNAFPGSMDDPITITLFFHIGEESGNPYLNEEGIERAKEELLAKFGPWNIYFNYCIDYIDCPCSVYDFLALFETYSDDNGINVYWGQGFSSNSGGIPSKNIMLTSINHLAHEMGHALGLNHTFHGTPCSEPDGLQENAPYYNSNGILQDGPFCEDLGDFVCDTPADPYKKHSGPTTEQGCFNYTHWTGSENIFFNPDPENPLYQDLLGHPYIDPENIILSNIMSYSRINLPFVFTEGQNIRMRDMIYTAPGLVDILSDFDFSDEAYIDMDQTWNEDKDFQNDLIVKSGVNLVINSKVGFVPGTALILEEGASLVLNGTLTVSDFITQCPKATNSDLWKGVRLITGKDPASGQMTSIHQNGTIEHAEIGIDIQNGVDDSFWLIAQDGFFINNERSFKSTDNLTGIALFRTCDFVLDHNYLSNNYFNQIELYLAKAWIQGCNFEDLIPHGNGHNRSAIYGWGSNISVSDIYMKNTKISNFTSGVKLLLGYNKYVKIEHTDFLDNEDGVNAKLFSNINLKGNMFELNSGGSNFGGIDQHGVNIDQARGLKFEMNELKCSGNNTSSYGARIISSGEWVSNALFDNTFYRINHSIVAEGANNKLKFLCNNFESCPSYDIRVNSGRISSFQGSTEVPAGNVFSHTGTITDSDFSNEEGDNDQVNYYYNKNNPAEKPLFYSKINPEGSENENSACTATLGGDNFEEIDSIYKKKIEEIDDKWNKDHPEVVVCVWDEDIDTDSLVDVIVNLGPWWSDEAAVNLLSNADDYTENQLVQMMTANPDVLRDPSINNYVFGPGSLFSPNNLAALSYARRTVTERGMMEAALSMLELRWNHALSSEIETRVLSEQVDYDKLRLWLGERSDLESAVAIAETWADQKDYNRALSELQSILQNRELSQRETTDMTNLIQLNSILYVNYAQGKYEWDLNNQEVAVLLQITNSVAGIANNRARMILNEFYAYDFELLDIPVELVSFPPFSLEPRSRINQDIEIRPNPGDGHVELILPDGKENVSWQFSLFDFSGKVLYTEKFHSSEANRKTMDFSSFPEGIYLYELKGENDRYTGKLSIHK